MIETASLVEGLVGKEVVVQASDLQAEFRVKGRLVSYSDSWAEPELLVLEEADGNMLLLRNWSLVAVEG
jgi:hypothetical protein